MNPFVTGIKGLDDEMLYGGFNVLQDRGYLLLIKGDIGTGKSILASQIVANYAKTNLQESVLYLTTEYNIISSLPEVKNRFQRYSFGKDIIFFNGGEVRELNKNWTKRSKKLKNKGLVFIEYPICLSGIELFAAYFSGLGCYPHMTGTYEAYNSLPRPLGVCVIDSLDCFGDGISKNKLEMAFSPILKNSGKFGILLKKNADSDLSELVDAIIELSILHEGIESKRYMEVLKAKTQGHYLGKKEFSITDSGILFKQ